MFGILLKAGAVGVIGYGIAKVLEHYEVGEKLAAGGTALVDKLLTSMVSFGESETPVAAPTSPAPAPTPENVPTWKGGLL
jgi:hypothetical protein